MPLAAMTMRASAFAGIGYWVAGGVSAQEAKADRLNIACIGVGGKGSSDASQAAKFGNIIAPRLPR